MRSQDDKTFLMIASSSKSQFQQKQKQKTQPKHKQCTTSQQQISLHLLEHSELLPTEQSTNRQLGLSGSGPGSRQEPQSVPLNGIQQDIKRFQQRFKDHMPMVQETSKSKQLLLRKKYIISWLSDKFQKSKNQVYLFYSGHGDLANGDWNIDAQTNNPNIKQDALTLEQLLQSWKTKKPSIKSKLIIFMDSCYSGNWCYRLSQMSGIKNVSIFASCDRTQQSIDLPEGGLLSRCLLEHQSKFQSNYNLLVHYQTPVFYSQAAQRYSVLLKSHLKILNNSVTNYAKLKSGQPTQDKFQGIKDVNDFRTGKGAMYYADGSEYEGYWKQDKHHGKGRFRLVNGDIYDGEWKQGKYHGKGTYVLADGAKYEGNWKEGVLHGPGRLILENGQAMQMEYKNGYKIK